MRDASFADAFTKAMDSRGRYLAAKLALRLDVRDRRMILDVAGGSGIYACAFIDANPGLAAAVFEIPPVDEAARRSIAAKGRRDRVNVVAGDMFASLPGGYDIHLFANVLHDWSFDDVRRLARRSYEALADDGIIVVFDAHLNPEKDGPLAVAEYSCLLMHSTEGRCYSTREIGAVLEAAGFTATNVKEIAASRSVITAVKPKRTA
jgi:SAM-dependent methyltransferase